MKPQNTNSLMAKNQTSTKSKAFWTALWAGLAAPTALYGAPGPYAGYVVGKGLTQSNAQVVGHLSEASSRVRSDVRRKRGQ
jgi:hypothetical protein